MVKMTDIIKLLKEHGYTLEDVSRAFEEKIKELEKKKYVEERLPSGEIVKRPVGKFVTLKQSNYPVKMFVLQEILGREPEIRIGYYIVSEKKLREGKLSLQWGEKNPNIPKKDFKLLIKKAEEKGII